MRRYGGLWLAVLTLSILFGGKALGSRGCTDQSLRLAAWNISDLGYTGGSGDGLHFQLHNIATDYTTECISDAAGLFRCSPRDPASIQPAQSGAVNTTIVFHRETNILEIHQAWGCEDIQNRPYIFRASANVAIRTECEASTPGASQQSVYLGHGGLVRASLSSPVTIDYLPPIPAPPGLQAPGCMAASTSPSWEITSFSWRWTFMTMLEIGVMPSVHITFNITNQANGVTTNCTAGASSTPLSGDIGGYRAPGSYWIDCDSVTDISTGSWTRPQLIPPNRFVSRPNHKIRTYFSYVNETATLGINQTWYCESGHGELVTHFQGGFSVPLLLKCDSIPVDWKNPPLGQETRNCSLPPTIIQGTVWSRTDLPRSHLSLPDPWAPSCTVDSFYDSKSYIATTPRYEERFESTALGGPGGFYSELSTGVQLYGVPYGSSPDYVYSSCWAHDYFGGTAKRGNTSSCETSFPYSYKPSPVLGSTAVDREANLARLSMSWICSDLDPMHPVVFNITGSLPIPQNCTRDPDGPCNDTVKYSCIRLRCWDRELTSQPMLVSNFSAFTASQGS